MHYFIIFILFYTSSLHAMKPQEACTEFYLKKKDCSLGHKNLKIHIWKGGIFVNDGIHRSTSSFSYDKEHNEWVKVELYIMNDKYFVSTEAWGDPSGENQIQDLEWNLFIVQKEKVILLLKKSIQKRIPSFKEEKKGFHLEKKEPISFAFGGPHKLLWKIGKKNGDIDLKNVEMKEQDKKKK